MQIYSDFRFPILWKGLEIRESWFCVSRPQLSGPLIERPAEYFINFFPSKFQCKKIISNLIWKKIFKLFPSFFSDATKFSETFGRGSPQNFTPLVCSIVWLKRNGSWNQLCSSSSINIIWSQKYQKFGFCQRETFLCPTKGIWNMP